MNPELTRRQVTAGMAGFVTGCMTGIAPALAAGAPRVPALPASRFLDDHYVMEKFRALYQTACDERAAFFTFARSGDGGMAWSRLYMIKANGAAALREWLERNAPWEQALKAWLDAVHPQGADQAASYAAADDSEVREAAWQILDKEPRTSADAARHRQAAERVFGKVAGAMSGHHP